jgi:predicted 2-oxoglutarate/Fe(II)-dependent dioxygenase YbiX
MPPPSFFASLGIFVRPRVLEGLLLTVIRDAVVASAGSKAAIGSAAGDAVNLRVRDVEEVHVPAKLQRDVERRIHSLHALFELHAGQPLVPAPPVSFLRHRAGGRYRPHRDRAESRADPAAARALSVVLFLNDHRSDSVFTGGQLRFYGILGAGALSDIGLAMEAEAGTLVAFDSSLMHEVAEVIEGVRCSAVCGFDERSS